MDVQTGKAKWHKRIDTVESHVEKTNELVDSDSAALSETVHDRVHKAALDKMASSSKHRVDPLL